jgi:arylsulfatase A-like enzyme
MDGSRPVERNHADRKSQLNTVPELPPSEAYYGEFPGEAVWMDNRYKLVTDGKKNELFDIVADPLEKNNLAEDKSGTTAKMKARLEA